MSKRTLALVATIIGSGMVVLDGFVVNLALPAIKADFHTQFANLQWVVDAYLLFLSTLILVGGSLGDILGRKRMYIIGLSGFTVGSVLCGLAPDINYLIGFRILQGIFGALLVPGGLAIINTNFPKEERGKAIGRWSAWLAVVTPIGPVLGGYIINAASWRWIFFINIPLGVVCGYLAINYFSESRDSNKRKLDSWGALLAVASLAGVTYGLIEGPAGHWGALPVISLLVGIGLFLGFLQRESKATDPMMRLSLFNSRSFSAANTMTFLQYGALSGFMFAMLIYLQTKIGYSALVAGLSLLPISILLLLLSGRFGALSAKLGPRVFISSGPLLCAASMVSLINYQPGYSYWSFLLPRIFVFGLGMALLVAPLTITVMSSVADADSGIASGVNNAVARVAGLIIVALLGVAGAGDVYRFSMILCACLAAAAGIISFIYIGDTLPARRSKIS